MSLIVGIKKVTGQIDLTQHGSTKYCTGGGGSGIPSDTVVTEKTPSQQENAGQSSNYSRGDHTHGTPVNPVTGHEQNYSHGLLHSNSLDHSNTLDHSNSLDHLNANDPSASEKLALPGTNGTPSETNKYVTNSDPRNTDARTPTIHNQDASTINAGTLDGDRLPIINADKKGGVPPTGTPSGKYLKDDGTWAVIQGGSGLTHGEVMSRLFLGC